MTDQATVPLELVGWSRAHGLVDASPQSLHPAEVYRRLAPAVLGYFRARGAPEPEDLTGDVFVDVTRNLHRFRGDEERLRAWVFTIARRRLVDDHRRWARRPRMAATDLASTGMDPPDPHRFDEHLTAELAAALAQLPKSQREVLLLRFVADLPHGEIARMLHRPAGAVKALQRRGLDRLAVLLGED